MSVSGHHAAGCAYGTLNYDAQLALKEKQVRDKLIRLGGLTDPKMQPIMGMGNEETQTEPFRYRNQGEHAGQHRWTGDAKGRHRAAGT